MFTRSVNADDMPQNAARRIGRLFLGTTACAALICAAIMAFEPPDLTTALRSVLVGSAGFFGLLCALASRLGVRPGFPMNAVLCAVAVVAILLTGMVSVLLDEGLRSPPLAFCGLIVCVAGTITGVRGSLLLGALAAVQMAAIAWAHARGWIAPGPPGTALLYQWLVVACGTLGGGLIARVLGHTLNVAAERELRFRSLLHVAVDWYWELDRDFRFTYISEARLDASGIARSAHMHRTPWQIPDMGLTDAELDAHRADLEAHLPFRDLRAQRRNRAGDWRTVTVSGEPRFDAGGVFVGYWGVARDVTDEVMAQRALAASEMRYRELFTRSPSPLLLHRGGVVFDANDAAARLFAFGNAQELVGLNLPAVFAAGATRDRLDERLHALERMAVGEGLPVADFQLRARDGRPVSVQATAVRIDTASGPANLTIIFDISARKAVEGALRRSEAMLSHLFATSPDCITLTEMSTGHYAMVNEAFTRLTGYRADEVIGRSAADLGLWHDPADRTRLLAGVERDGRVVEMAADFISRSGVRVSAVLSAGRFMMDQREYLVINSRDVTEIERARLQHTAILERASIGIAFTRYGHFVDANPFFGRMFGWNPGELQGQPGAVVWPGSDEYREMTGIAAPLLSAGRPFETERRMRRKDGSDFWCRLLAQVVDRDDPNHGGTIWIAEDVTERRRLDAALAAARDAAEAASRAKSSFLANTSHEIRTPLNGLLGLTRLAMQADLPEARRQQYLAQILDSAQSLAGILSDILDVSRIEAGKLALDDTPFDLREALMGVHHAYESLAEVKGLALLLTIDERLPANVRGDPVRVRQILSNFITNALKFTAHGHVRIEATQIATGRVRLAVSDTGPGVAPATQALLFTPFSQGDSSTTRRFGGTGLGLSICRELAELMGGTVGVQSTPGYGSTFWAELPLPATAPSGDAASTEAGDVARLFGKRVLMVEDNAVNMMISVAMLEQWGVQVSQAADGRAAIDDVLAAARDGKPFDLVVMDVQMPNMGGHEATRELRRHFDAAALPILALTAAALVSERDEALAAGMNEFLTKPIDATRLRQALAALLPPARRA